MISMYIYIRVAAIMMHHNNDNIGTSVWVLLRPTLTVVHAFSELRAGPRVTHRLLLGNGFVENLGKWHKKVRCSKIRMFVMEGRIGMHTNTSSALVLERRTL